MTEQPELDEQDISLLSGESGKEPLGALGAFALRCMHKGWDMSDFAAAAEGSRILESLCTDGNRYRPQRAGAKLSSAWQWAEKTFSPTFEIKQKTAPDNLRREVIKSGLMEGDDLAVLLGLIEKAERDGHNPVIGPCRAVADLIDIGHMRVNRAMQRLGAAASPNFPIREVADHRLRSGANKGSKTRLWTLNFGWRATCPQGDGGDIPVSAQVPKLTREDRISYFRRCIGNLPLGEFFTTAEITRKAGVPYDNKSREALNLLHEQGEVDRFSGSTRTGTKSYRWGRYPTAAEEAERKAKASAQIEANIAKYRAELAGESACPFPVGRGPDERPCGCLAPAGQRYCPTHQRAMDHYRENEDAIWRELRSMKPPPPGRSPRFVYPDNGFADPFEGAPLDDKGPA
jgi:hypothetical protein